MGARGAGGEAEVVGTLVVAGMDTPEEDRVLKEGSAAAAAREAKGVVALAAGE